MPSTSLKKRGYYCQPIFGFIINAQAHEVNTKKNIVEFRELTIYPTELRGRGNHDTRLDREGLASGGYGGDGGFDVERLRRGDLVEQVGPALVDAG